MSSLQIILASASPARLELLKRIKVIPDLVQPADIDESELPRELPNKLAVRLAYSKAIAVTNNVDQAIVIAADTVVAKGRKILPKALTDDDIRYCLKELSQCRHRVYTGVCIIKKTEGQLQVRQKLVQTIVQFKKLTNTEINFYCHIGEGINNAGGYSIGGYAESFVSFISGSYSNVIGLPLREVVNILNSL